MRTWPVPESGSKRLLKQQPAECRTITKIDGLNSETDLCFESPIRESAAERQLDETTRSPPGIHHA